MLDDEGQLTSSIIDGYGRGLCSLVDPGTVQQIADSPRRTFVRNMFNQSMECFSGALQTCVATCWLNFERGVLLCERNTKQHNQCYRAARKLAKSLLKLERYRNNLGLWFAFIEIEWVSGNVEEARRVVCSLLEQLPNVADEMSIKRYYNFVK